MLRQSFFTCAALILLATVGANPVKAQEQTTAPAGGAATPPQLNWATNCVAPSRSGPFDCTIEQRVLIKETGQQLGRLMIKVGGTEPRKPSLVIQLPFGLSLRDGIKLSIDGKQFDSFDIQTCDASGCYAGATASSTLLEGMKSGKELKVNFLDMQKNSMAISFVLAGFTAAYANVQ
ncbi:MAG: invasion associated locus B family protein [Alphaproteobacteria bacterium]|uniref:invasion associated locus B family protein n=1 Tax=Aestuariivirga sp. TaxID=2650926 RepID=UPI00301A4CFD|nr:invasion associated locus B family protein [Alphaproteobacteria bacterium]